MSCFTVDPEHIDALIAAYRQHKESFDDGAYYRQGRIEFNAQRVGAMLWDENVSAVRDRYPKLYEDMIPMPPEGWGSYPYRTPTPVEALSLLDCYEYQASDSGTWDVSEAKVIVDRMRSTFIHALSGYDDAPWMWSREHFEAVGVA